MNKFIASRVAGAGCLCLLLGGAAHATASRLVPSLPPVTGDRTLRLAQAAAIDGIYVGTIELGGNSHPRCGKNQGARMTIQNNRLEYKHYGGYAVYDVPVGSDGSFSGTATNTLSHQPQTLKGRVMSGTIEADTATGLCSYHLVLHRK